MNVVDCEPNKAYIRLMKYHWELPDWPEFKVKLDDLGPELLRYEQTVGRLLGTLDTSSSSSQTDITVQAMIAEALKNAEIEGEYFSREDVASSIRKNVGITLNPRKPHDKRAVGIATLTTQARLSFQEPITAKAMRQWHALLMEWYPAVHAGKYRTGTEPMQVVSGAAGRETVHYQAPPSERVPQEMKDLEAWLKRTNPGGTQAIPHAPVRAALAHLRFETIHPFEDGNGRIGRTLAEAVLFQHCGHALPMSLSSTIDSHRKAYYANLKKAQRTLEVTPWVSWFTEICNQALEEAIRWARFTIQKAQFLDKHKPALNPRQFKVLLRMLDAGPEGFEGGMNAKKYMSLTGASKATATRDLQAMRELGVFVVEGGGRSTRYGLGEM
jgi:Fic family protein